MGDDEVFSEMEDTRDWQDFANCLGVDPDIFSRKGVLAQERLERFVEAV